MNTQVSNRRVLYMFLFLGLVLLPALGIIPLVFMPRDLPAGKGPSTGTLIGWPAFFLIGGAAVTAYAVRRCPASFSFADVLTVRYLFHERVIQREDVISTSLRERSGTVGGPGDIPLSASDHVVSLQLADGSKLSWGVSSPTALRLEVLLGVWLQRNGDGQEPVLAQPSGNQQRV